MERDFFPGGNVMGDIAGKESGLPEDVKTRKMGEEHVAFLLRAWYKLPWRQREEKAFFPGRESCFEGPEG